MSSLGVAVGVAREQGVLNRVRLIVMDNGPGPQWRAEIEKMLSQAAWCEELRILAPGRNLGFGGGHNRALEQARAAMHLVLNPDVELEKHALVLAMEYIGEHPGVGMVTPLAHWPSGKRQWLCKRYPAVFDLFLRGFGPEVLRRRYSQRMARYEMRDLSDDRPDENVSIASGCFMLLRRKAVETVGGFSPAFFLYFEDFDFCLRIRAAGWRIAFVPGVKIVHHGGNAARKGMRHLWLFCRSAFRFYQRHGWRFL